MLEAGERLKRTEQIAFAATQGLYDRAAQTYVSDGVPDLKYASELVHASAYETQSADLAKAVAFLSLATDERTAAARMKAASALERYILMTLGVDLALLPALLMGLYALQNRLHRFRCRTFQIGVFDTQDECAAEMARIDGVVAVAFTGPTGRTGDRG